MKLISGGQTGVDMAALEFAIEAGMRHGGWVPKGRTNEAGVIPSCIGGLVEADDAQPETRTRLNVLAADATLIISDGSRSPGTDTTIRFAAERNVPIRLADLNSDLEKVSLDIRNWISRIGASVLNVAGPRESEAPGINAKAKRFLTIVFHGPN